MMKDDPQARKKRERQEKLDDWLGENVATYGPVGAGVASLISAGHDFVTPGSMAEGSTPGFGGKGKALKKLAKSPIPTASKIKEQDAVIKQFKRHKEIGEELRKSADTDVARAGVNYADAYALSRQGLLSGIPTKESLAANPKLAKRFNKLVEEARDKYKRKKAAEASVKVEEVPGTLDYGKMNKIKQPKGPATTLDYSKMK